LGAGLIFLVIFARIGSIARPNFFRSIPTPETNVYKVIFHNANQVFEVFARQIYQSDMWGFIEIEEFVFGERSQIVVDPSEEKLKNEFAGVKRTYIPYQSVIRIDEVEKEGSSKISEVPAGGTAVSNVTRFPYAGMAPPSDD